MDINYLLHRQQAERSRAETARTAAARKAHEQLASEYERMIEDATNGRICFVRSTTLVQGAGASAVE